jgi:hypothetical protein
MWHNVILITFAQLLALEAYSCIVQPRFKAAHSDKSVAHFETSLGEAGGRMQGEIRQE